MLFHCLSQIEGLQERVKSKEGTIERKSRESQNALSDRRRLELEMADLRDLLDSKERKITSLNVDVSVKLCHRWTETNPVVSPTNEGQIHLNLMAI